MVTPARRGYDRGLVILSRKEPSVQKPRLVPLVLLATAVAGLLGASALLPAPAAAEDAAEIPLLERHPFFDAKPGEFLRWKDTAGEETSWFLLRVLATNLKENKVFVEVHRTDEAGTTELETVARGKWVDIPKFEAKEGQTFKRDEMVMKEVAGKKVACRYLLIEEQMNPPMPAPLRKRKVWYSNEVLGSGKVEEIVDSPVSVKAATSWGMLDGDALAKRRAVYEELKDFKDDPPATADKPAGSAPVEKPADQPAPSKPAGGCGGAGGCGK
jgi:hypothetical protein